MPRWRDFKPLVRLRPFVFRPTERRLGRALTIWDLRAIAKERTPKAVFDYTDGAADQEIGLNRARELFSMLEFRPSVLRDVSSLSTETLILGAPSSLPFVLAPTGFTRMMHHSGEVAVSRVAERWAVPYVLSTLGTTSIEKVAAVAPAARKMFQLYAWKDRAAGEDLMTRAAEAGYEALILTVDAPVAGARLRDARNGFTIPPTLTPRTIVNAAMHPAWWVNLLTTEPLTFASLMKWDRTVAELMDELFDPTMTVSDLEWVREFWAGPLVVKGIQTVDDARRVADAGADGIVLSNHGGRQLDRAPIPLRLVPDVREAVGDRAEVIVDTGIMSGADIVAAVALGAHSTMIGRAYLYGLMAGGEHGVDCAVRIVEAEIRRTMALLGVRSIAELGPDHVALP